MGKINKGFWSYVHEYTVITLGILLYVLGWVVFLLPNNLIGGGVTGLSSIVQYATGGAIKVGTTYFCVNVLLLIAAFFTLGKSFGGKTVYAIILASLALNLGQEFMPKEICQALGVENGKLLSTIIGGLLSGLGIGMTMSHGGSTGGTDIIALIVNKYRNVSPGRMLIMIDACIILSSLLVPSYTADGGLMPWTEKITTVVYAFILITASSMTLDVYLSGSKQSVQMFIFSKKYDEIADAINNDLHRGATVLTGEGWHSKSEVHIVMVITRRNDTNLLLKYINAIDPESFVSVASISGVYGKGFEAFKFPKKKTEEIKEEIKEEAQTEK